MIIDLYTHLAPHSFLQRIEGIAPQLGNIVNRLLAVKPLLDLDARFRDMDQIPDYRQVISLPNPALEDIGDHCTGPELARIANDEMAALCERYPDRFIGFAAALYLDNVEAAIVEAQRAVIYLGAKGVLIYNHVNGHPLDEPRFRPFFAALSQLDRPIWLHPTRTAFIPDYKAEAKSRFEMWWCFGWPYDTSVAMARLVFDGLFDRHPNLQIITHHAGGMIPFFDGRIGEGMHILGARTSDEDYSGILPALKRPHIDYFKLFYGDTAMFGSTNGVRCALDFFGTDKIVFATDAPLGPIAKTYQGIAAMDVPAQIKAAIFYDNAAHLLRLEGE
jgi:aminocarboxymuconate-semialdehyde decarboxylase